jgi:hypothetical protein
VKTSPFHHSSPESQICQEEYSLQTLSLFDSDLPDDAFGNEFFWPSTVSADSSTLSVGPIDGFKRCIKRTNVLPQYYYTPSEVSLTSDVSTENSTSRTASTEPQHSPGNVDKPARSASRDFVFEESTVVNDDNLTQRTSDSSKARPIPIPSLVMSVDNPGSFEESHNLKSYHQSDEQFGPMSSTPSNAPFTAANLRQRDNFFNLNSNAAPLLMPALGPSSVRSRSSSGPTAYRVAGSFVDTPRSVLANPEMDTLIMEHIRNNPDEYAEGANTRSTNEEEDFSIGTSSDDNENG